MAYPDRLLAPDEEVIRHLHPHWLTLVRPVVVFLVVIGAASFGIAAIPDGASQGWLRVAILVLALLVLVAFALVPVLRWATTHYVVTSHRVMLRTGILSRHGKDILFPRITDVSYTQTLFDRLVGAGTLTVESAGEGPAQVFTDIPRSDEVQQLINRLVEEDDGRRSGRRPEPRDDADDIDDRDNGSDHQDVDLGREQTRRFRRDDT